MIDEYASICSLRPDLGERRPVAPQLLKFLKEGLDPAKRGGFKKFSSSLIFIGGDLPLNYYGDLKVYEVSRESSSADSPLKNEAIILRNTRSLRN